jgi:hypothetical protein
MFAYEGIRTAILTGLDVQENGIWHDKIFIPNGRRGVKVKILKYLTVLIDMVSITDYTNKALRFLLYKVFSENYGTPHLIPAKYLEYFTTYKHENKGIPDLFQVLGDFNIRSTWIEPKLNSLERRVLKNLPHLFSKYSFIVVKLNSLDRLGHKYGPLSNEVRQRVKYLDTLIEIAMNDLQNKVRDFSFIIISDHGMSPVERSVNLEQLLEKEERVKPIKDYIPYIGSTFAAFYIINKSAKEALHELLNDIRDYGKVLSDDEMKAHGINQDLYGHLIFALNEGVVFFPSFFQRRELPKGMHGYLHSSYDNAIFISSLTTECKNTIQRSLKFSDIFNYIVNFWNIKSSFMEGYETYEDDNLP